MNTPRALARAASRLVLAASFASIVALGVGPLAHPAPAAAATASTMEAQIVGWINDARAKNGLAALHQLPALTDLAGDRATTMASTGVLAHPSCLSCTFNSRGIQWYSIGEAIAWSGYPWGDQAASTIFNSWKNSPMHWNLLMSSRFNYIGLGIAYRSSGSQTYAAADLSESKDQTSPWARVGGAARNGSTVSWTWSGADTRLQTHTSGLKNFEVQYRVGSGSWSTIRSGTTATSLSLAGRAGGHYYGLRVRSRDNRGYLSAWTAEMRVWVP